MASKLQPATPRTKPPTRPTSLDPGGKALPVTKAISGHGREGTPKPTLERRPSRSAHTEKRTLATRGTEPRQAQEDHIKAKEQLASIEKSKSNLMQDLARAKRNVEELTTMLNGVNTAPKKDEVGALDMEHGTFLEKEEWQIELDAMKQQYESAVLELQTSKQAMESLKHELMVCVEAKDEAVRLAGEAMCAAETTARRVEQLSTELFTTKGSVVEKIMAAETDDLIDEVPLIEQSSLETDKNMMKEETGMQASQERFDPELVIESFTDAVVRMDAERVDVPDVMEPQCLASTLKALQSEMAAAKEAEQKALNMVLAIQADIARAGLERDEAKSAESTAQALLAKVSTELEAAEEKLASAILEEAALVSSLEFLKTQLEKRQQEAMEARHGETRAKILAAELTACMEESKELNRAELMLLKEREMSAHGTIESLKTQLESQKLELVSVAERESMVAAKVADMIKEVERSRNGLIEHQKQSTYELATLSVELEATQGKLVLLEERDSINATKIATLVHDFEKQKSEARDLQERLCETESKANALSDELAVSQSKNTSLPLLEKKVEEANAEIGALNAEVCGLKQALEEALNAREDAKDDLCNLRATLEKAVLDKEEATREAQAALVENELNKQIGVDALAKAQALKEDAERALEAAHLASNAGMEEALIVAKSAEAAAQLAREEAQAVKEKWQAATTDTEMARADGEKAMREAQSLREEGDLLKAALAVEKERANAFEDEGRALLDEVKTLRNSLIKSQTETMEARNACANAESGLQNAMEELMALKSSVLKEECNVDHREGSSILLQEELDDLKERLQAGEERFSAAMNEVQALKSSKEELFEELEVVRVERETSQRAVVEAHQLLADMEKAKWVMEADIQRLLDDSKLWKTPKDSRDILVLSEINGNGHLLAAAESREEKPQPDSPSRDSEELSMAILLHVDEEKRQDEVIIEREEMEAPPQAAALPVVVKKRKHALLHRLHSYLEKKKIPHTP